MMANPSLTCPEYDRPFCGNALRLGAEAWILCPHCAVAFDIARVLLHSEALVPAYSGRRIPRDIESTEGERDKRHQADRERCEH
jgi:hypothetical protein